MIEKRSGRRKPDGRDPGEPDIRDRYESPVITSCSSEEILEQVGPAHACSSAPCGIF